MSSASPIVDNDKTWGLRIPKVMEALKIVKSVRQPVVAIVDQGMDIAHPALKDSIAPGGHNFAGGDENDPRNRTSYESHATHVGGTVGAKRSDDGFQGIANGMVKLMPVRVLNEGGSGTLISVARGITWAADQGVDVINMSLGTPSYSRALHDTVKYAVNEKKVSVVCAKGNSGTNRPNYPSDFPECIAVPATSLYADGTEGRAHFSNWGKNSTCCAPGHFIYSTVPDGKYAFYSGTSMACPEVAGCVAVILSQEKKGAFTTDQVRKILEEYGDEITADHFIGRRINLLKCIQKSSHDLLLNSLPLLGHPYGQCCTDAGIVARYELYINQDSGVEIYREGTEFERTVTRNGDGITSIFQFAGLYFVAFEPFESNHYDEPCIVIDYTDPKNPLFDASDWCGQHQEFHKPRPEYMAK